MDKTAHRPFSLPRCFQCAHIEPAKTGARCSAYPDGIPARFKKLKIVHDQVESDQVGTAVFTPAFTEVEA